MDYLDVPEPSAPAMSQRAAELVIEEAITEARIGSKGNFPGPLFLALPPVEMEWPQRIALAAASGKNQDITYDDLLRAATTADFTPYYRRFLFGSVAEHLADTFGTKGSPIAISTACASGATAIQQGVEAIRRGETEVALCAGTDASVNPESLIRFSLLSALSRYRDEEDISSCERFLVTMRLLPPRQWCPFRISQFRKRPTAFAMWSIARPLVPFTFEAICAFTRVTAW